MKTLFPALLLAATLFVSDAENKVYICTGPKSECYHKSSTCRGLSKCSGQVKQVTLKEAQQLHRRACKICY